MDAVQEIKTRLNIEDVVSEYVQLKRAGRNFKGLSPFTNEKTPSFIVSPEKQIWHDFSSGRGGDMFSFVQEVEGLDFKGSLELLARKAGVDLESFRGQSTGDGKQRERLFLAVESAVRFYQKQLTQNEQALTYVRKTRAYAKQTILDFRFGYSPKGKRALTNYLKSQNFTDGELQKAGLVTNRQGQITDMFHDRLMIPLSDSQGRPVGFTARLLKKDDNSPKYINTPSTLLYDKSRQLFGFSAAREYIRKSGYAVVVEGNLDVVASHQAGVKQVVASAGTALTAFHLKELQRFTGDVRLAFDDDRAGQEAAERTIPLAQATGIELSFVKIPAGKDPDELIRQDISLWLETVEKPLYMVDWLIERAANEYDLTTAPGKRQFTTKIMGTLKHIQDEVEREHYIRMVADRTKTSFETVQKKLFQEAKPITRRLKHVQADKIERNDNMENTVREQHYLSILLAVPELRQESPLVPLEVFSAESKEFINETKYLEAVNYDSEYAKMLTLLFEETYQHTEREELAYQVRQLANRLASHYIRDQKNKILKKLETADEHQEEELLRRVHELEQLRIKVSTDRQNNN